MTTSGDDEQCGKQSYRGSIQAVSEVVICRGTVQRSVEAFRHSRIVFLGYLVTISIPIEFYVWGRLCTHFEAVKVMTFAPVTQHFSRLNTPARRDEKRKIPKIFLFFWKKEKGIEKEKIQISHSSQGSRSRAQ